MTRSQNFQLPLNPSDIYTYDITHIIYMNLYTHDNLYFKTTADHFHKPQKLSTINCVVITPHPHTYFPTYRIPKRPTHNHTHTQILVSRSSTQSALSLKMLIWLSLCIIYCRFFIEISRFYRSQDILHFFFASTSSSQTAIIIKRIKRYTRTNDREVEAWN